MSAFEINQEIKKMTQPLECSDAASTSPSKAMFRFPRSSPPAPLRSPSHRSPLVESLHLQELDGDIQLPFGDRPLEILELLHHPSNTSLLKNLVKLDTGNVWLQLEPLLSISRTEVGDEALVRQVQDLIAPVDPSRWIRFRGLIGADHLDVPGPSPPRPRGRSSFDIRELDFTHPVLPRHASFDSVFLSDSDSCVSMTPNDASSPCLSTRPGLHHEPLVGLPLKSPRPRLHNRTTSHGGAIAYPHPFMDPIEEDADNEDGLSEEPQASSSALREARIVDLSRSACVSARQAKTSASNNLSRTMLRLLTRRRTRSAPYKGKAWV